MSEEPSGAKPDLRGKTVLLLEDNADSRGVLSFTCKSLGAKIVEAKDVETGQQLAIQTFPDLIVTDIALPDATGFDFVKWLRSFGNKRLAQTPCIAITAYPERFPANTADGFSAYMRKPIQIPSFCTAAVALAHARDNDSPSSKRPR